MREFIQYLESLKDNPQYGNIKTLLEELVLKCEAAYSKELWDNVPSKHSSIYTTSKSVTNESYPANPQQHNDRMFDVNNGNTPF